MLIPVCDSIIFAASWTVHFRLYPARCWESQGWERRGPYSKVLRFQKVWGKRCVRWGGVKVWGNQFQKYKIHPSQRRRVQDFPGGPVVRTPSFHCGVRSLVGELRPHMLCPHARAAWPKKNKTNKKKKKRRRVRIQMGKQRKPSFKEVAFEIDHQGWQSFEQICD